MDRAKKEKFYTDLMKLARERVIELTPVVTRYREKHFDEIAANEKVRQRLEFLTNLLELNKSLS